jgi:GrpB-like predicted nucleotidyltransferase (UPF0157 family)
MTTPPAEVPSGPVLRVAVHGARSGEVAALLRGHDAAGLLAVAAGPGRDPVALVIGTSRAGERADVLLAADEPLAAQVSGLWSARLGPFARRLAGIEPSGVGPPVLHDHDPEWPAAAQRLLGRLRAGLTARGLDDGRWTYDHIGSTSVPGLRAKHFIDLQIGAVVLPAAGSAADEVLAQAGYLPAAGSRPDSPGVNRDGVLDPDLAPAESYRKRLYFRPDPAQPSILHVRLLGSPWWSYTVRFRDWLRASSDGRRAYQAVKEQAAAAHARDADFDDYTRAKGAFFLEVPAACQPPPGGDQPA